MAPSNFLRRLLKLKRRSRSAFKSRGGYFETHSSWKELEEKSTGYQSPEILSAVSSASKLVLDGLASYERDGVAFGAPQYSWPLLSLLLWEAARNQGSLRVLDYGGSLGSSFLQHRPWFADLKDVEWDIVEQDEFVVEGRVMDFPTNLKFLSVNDFTVARKTYDVALFGSSLQYCEHPLRVLRKTAERTKSLVILDRSPFSDDAARLVLQVVPPNIYRASYPMHILNKEETIQCLEPDWTALTEYPSIGGSAQTSLGASFEWSGLALVRKERNGQRSMESPQI